MSLLTGSNARAKIVFVNVNRAHLGQDSMMGGGKIKFLGEESLEKVHDATHPTDCPISDSPRQ